ncbi:hypothetical protein SEPCBS57363_004776 [Sporothrix epigloea]|uniref:Uncharacterized protein n=1 Tax=Sporothrix epigloea TaxID=1892477 RepID=A0ABP0DVT3_9PEZI
MKAAQTLAVLAAAFGSATASWNATATDVTTVIATAPCPTGTPYGTGVGTGTGFMTATANSTYTKAPPSQISGTVGPSAVVTAGASSVDVRVYFGAAAAVAAIAFSL